MKKHIGWFDDRDHAPGIVTNILASDIQALNGVSQEGLGVVIECLSAMTTGLILGKIKLFLYK